MAFKNRPKRGKRGQATDIERLVGEDGKRPGYTRIMKFDKTGKGRSVGRIHIPLENIPTETVKEMLDREIKEPDGSTRNVQLQSLREQSGDTEYFVSNTVFSVEIYSNSITRRAFKRFCQHNNVLFKDVPTAIQTWLNLDALNGRCRVSSFTGLPVECRNEFVPVGKGEASKFREHPKEIGVEREKLKSGLTVCITFSGITDEFRQRLMSQTWVQTSYTIKERTPATSSMLHRLGERLKHKKKYAFERSEENKAFRALEESFGYRRNASGHRTNKQICDKLFKKNDKGITKFSQMAEKANGR